MGLGEDAGEFVGCSRTIGDVRVVYLDWRTIRKGLGTARVVGTYLDQRSVEITSW